MRRFAKKEPRERPPAMISPKPLPKEVVTKAKKLDEMAAKLRKKTLRVEEKYRRFIDEDGKFRVGSILEAGEAKEILGAMQESHNIETIQCELRDVAYSPDWRKDGKGLEVLSRMRGRAKTIERLKTRISSLE